MTPRRPPRDGRLAWVLCAVSLMAAGPFLGCGSMSSAPDNRAAAGSAEAATKPHDLAPAGPPDSPAVRFRDVSEGSGLEFVHVSGNSPEKAFPTCLGSGVALLDYDGDGWLDIYLASTRELPLDAPSRAVGNRLYRNRGGVTFEDVTEHSGAGFRGFNHGVAVGDVDNNGSPDLYLTNLGPNVLLMNQGDGTFRDATASSGLECPAWSCGAAFLDYDNDGYLDVYVSNYGEWPPTGPPPFCGDEARNIRRICDPALIPPQRHALFHNRGDGTFDDTTEAAGVLRHDGRGMGVVAADLNGDGRIDLYVANDKCPNYLFLNRGDGTFDDVSEPSGAAYSRGGEAQGSMGVDAEDLTGDGLPELVATNFLGEGLALYRNLGDSFLETSDVAGVVKDSRPYVGWGCALADFNGDGRLDLFVANGHVDDNLHELGKNIPQAEPAKFWLQGRRGRFQVAPDPGPFFASGHVARGAAFGDVDNDGDIDVVLNILDARPALLLNESPPSPWLRLELVGRRSNRSAIGAAVEVHCAGGSIIHRQVKGGGSYLSANDPRLLIGLGGSRGVERVEVRWPSGAGSVLLAPALNQAHRLTEPE